MKKLLLGMLTLTSLSTFAEDCKVSIYGVGPTDKQSEKFVLKVTKVLKDKNFELVDFVNYVSEVKTKYTISLATDGVFPISFTSSVVLIDNSQGGSDGMMVEKMSKLKLMRADDNIYLKLIKKLSSCEEI